MSLVRGLLSGVLALAFLQVHAASTGHTGEPAYLQKLRFGSKAAEYSFAVYSNHAVEAAPNSIQAAVIVQHGLSRDGNLYFSGTNRLARENGISANDTLLLAPQFFVTDDGSNVDDPSLPLWTAGGWIEGAESVGGSAKVSSFVVYDELLLWLADRRRFPALRRVVIAGHSGGGQLVQRYAVFSRMHDQLTAAGIDLRYVVANPSSYVYFTTQRPNGERFVEFDSAQCPRFNRYKYGFEDLVGYAARVSAPHAFVQYIQRDVVYLLGTRDSNPYHPVLDKSCAAQAQGRHRLERGQAYVRYVAMRAPDRTMLRHRAYEVLGVGHNPIRMFGSRCGVEAVFDRRAANTNAASCVDLPVSSRTSGS